MDAAEAVICGAGIAGVSVAFHLCVEQGLSDVVICDPRPPLSLTSDKSTECYRNWWPDPSMVALMNRSIEVLGDLHRRSEGAFNLNRRGYLYVTANDSTLHRMSTEAESISAGGAGAVWHNTMPVGATDGAMVLDRRHLLDTYPFLSSDTVGGMFVNGAGWMSAQQLGAWMLTEARRAGARLVPASVVGVRQNRDSVTGVVLDDGSVITTTRFVNAAGPMAGAVASLSGVDLPLVSEAHHKVAFRDHLAAIPRTAPMMIWCDPQEIDWSPEEAEMLAEAGHGELSAELPAFCHGRPEGGAESTWVLALWEHTRTVMEPTWPMPVDELHAEVVIRGMSRMIPRLSDYSGHLPQSVIDGGYYTKAPDNLPVLGPVGPQGMFVCAGLSGYGIMAAPAAGDVLARQLLEGDVPAWADRFDPARLFDPAYLEGIDRSDAGQL